MKKEYTVTRYFSKLSEGLKPYNVNDSISLTDNEAKPLLAGGFIKVKEKPKKQNKKAPITKKGKIETK